MAVLQEKTWLKLTKLSLRMTCF